MQGAAGNAAASRQLPAQPMTFCHVSELCHGCVQDIKGSVVGLSTHPYGCRVVQRVLEHCTIEEAKEHIRREILRSVGPLATDQYGNYVIQHMLEYGPESAR